MRTGGRGRAELHIALSGKAGQLNAPIYPPVERTLHAGFPPSSYPVVSDINLNHERASHLLDYLKEGSFLSQFATTQLTLMLASLNVEEQLYG